MINRFSALRSSAARVKLKLPVMTAWLSMIMTLLWAIACIVYEDRDPRAGESPGHRAGGLALIEDYLDVDAPGAGPRECIPDREGGERVSLHEVSERAWSTAATIALVAPPEGEK